MGTIEESTEIAVIERPGQISDSDSPPLLPSDSDDDSSLSEEPDRHSLLLPPALERIEQTPLPPPSDFQISPKRRGRQPTKRPRANTNSN